LNEEYYNWKTTPGIGDWMMGLNIAYRRQTRKNRPVTINFHWYHDHDHYHHCEDPETSIERFNYIHNFYYKTGAVNIEHTFNSTHNALLNNRWQYFKNGVEKLLDIRESGNTNSWVFDPRLILPTDDNKVVIWRPKMNAEIPRLWKMRVTDKEWDLLIDNLEGLGYSVVELEYKTPISEATYHINTCAFTLSYDGMWHYIAKNFFKPMIVLSNDAVTGFHTKHAVRISSKKTLPYCLNMNSKVKIDGKIISPHDRMIEKSHMYREEFWEWTDNAN